MYMYNNILLYTTAQAQLKETYIMLIRLKSTECYIYQSYHLIIY